MMHRRILAIMAVIVCIAVASCEAALGYLLVQELLDKKAPSRNWSGVVRDTLGRPVGGVIVQIRAEVVGDNDVMIFDDTTNLDGEYFIKWRWHETVDYHMWIVHEGEVLYQQSFGKVKLENQETDVAIQRTVGGEMSGVVRDWEGNPIEGALVIGASSTGIDDPPTTIKDQQNKIQYVITNESGVYSITGSYAKYGIICAYHPDHGFSYAYGEDTDSDGSLGLNVEMGDGGEHRITVQVVDGNLDPISNVILQADQQFRLRLEQPWNLSQAVDTVVTDESLFPTLGGNPSALHPETVTITVQSTGANGMADAFAEDVYGAFYEINLLNINNDEPATAIVQTDDPLVLHKDELVQVRVN